MTFEDFINRLPPDVVRQLKNTPQDPVHHPEGSVYEHTKQVFNLAKDDFNLQIAAIFHDLGKIDCTFYREDKQKLVSYGHELLAKNYIENYSHLFPEKNIDWHKVKYVCRNHMLVHRLEEMRPSKLEALKSSRHFEDLLKFGEFDSLGRKVFE